MTYSNLIFFEKFKYSCFDSIINIKKHNVDRNIEIMYKKTKILVDDLIENDVCDNDSSNVQIFKHFFVNEMSLKFL